MNRPLLILMLLLALAACGPTPTAVSSIPTMTAPIQNTEVGNPALSTNTPMAAMAFTPTLEGPTQPAGPLSFQVTSPQDDAVVNIPQVDVLGSAPAGTVLSINDEILMVGEDGHFQITVALEEGPNVLEIVASDVDGNELSQILTVTYEP